MNSNYVGFSTVNLYRQRQIPTNGVDGGVGTINNPPKLTKKYKLAGEQLVIQDFINSLSIKQGDKVGNPSYGTKIWSFIFEQNGPELAQSVVDEIQRMASQDPRIIMNYIVPYQEEHGILLEIQMSVQPFNNVIDLKFYLDKQSRTAANLT